jgi:O-antigen/teichoic acid export membrane protein
LTVIGSEQAPPAAGVVARLRSWLASDHSLVQRLAGAVFLVRVFSAALAFGAQILLARWMGSAEFGIYVYVWTWVLLLGGVADLGLASAAQRFVPEYTGLKAWPQLRGFLAGSRWLALGMATVLALAAAGLVWALSPWLNTYTLIPLYLACATLPAYALGGTQDYIARAYDWMALAYAPTFIIRQLLLLAIAGGAYAAGLPVDAVTVMLAGIVAIWATALGQAVMLNRRLRREVEQGPKTYALRLWLATALPIMLVEGFYLLLTYTDIILLEQFRPPEDVAFYYAAAKILSLVAFIHFAVSATTAHRFSQYRAAGDDAALKAFVVKSVKMTFWPSLAATVLLLALGKPMLWLFGPNFTGAYSLMFLLAAGLIARASVGPVERLLNMLGQQRACALVYAAAFVINLVLCLVFIPRYGAAGAAASTSVALIIESVLLFVVTRRQLGFHMFVLGARSAAVRAREA